PRSSREVARAADGIFRSPRCDAWLPGASLGDDMSTQINRLRIAHLIETNGPGGAEQMLVDMVRELQAAGCYNVVVAPAGGEEWLQQQLASVAGPGSVESFPVGKPLSPKLLGWPNGLVRI